MFRLHRVKETFGLLPVHVWFCKMPLKIGTKRVYREGYFLFSMSGSKWSSMGLRDRPIFESGEKEDFPKFNRLGFHVER